MISKYQQRKRGFNNILMFVGLMAMAMVAWLDYKNRLPERRPIDSKSATPISQIQFNNVNRVRTEIQRKDGQWVLQKPAQLLARDSRIKRLLEVGSFDFEEGFDADEVNLEAAGLGSEARTLTLDQNTYRFGGIEPVSGKRYIQLDNKVLLVEDRYLPLMDGGINALAELKLPFDAVSEIQLAGTTLQEEQLSTWRSSQAMGVRGSTAIPPTAQSLGVQSDTLDRWSAWQDKGLWVLQPPRVEYEYLISTAQAATLGLVQQ